MGKFLGVISILFFVSILLPQKINAATITVSPGQSIQTALNNANSGDTVLVQAGTYPGRLSLKKPSVKLVAQGKVLINGAIYVQSDNSTVQGFTISSPTEEAGIRTEANNNLIENNEIYHMKQDGIWFFGSNNVFRGNYIHDILAPGFSGDPHADCFQTWDWNWDTQNVVFENNFCNHTRSSGSNQIFMVEGDRLKNLTIKNNRLIMHDAGYSPVALWGGDTFLVEGNYICNASDRGGEAVYLGSATNVTVTNNTYSGYANLLRGSTTQSGNVRGSLPCDLSGNQLPPPSAIPEPSVNQVSPSAVPTVSQMSQKPGDADQNGKVDGLDYVVWLNNYNRQTQGSASGDFDNSGKVDGLDYVIWLNNYNR